MQNLIDRLDTDSITINVDSAVNNTTASGTMTNMLININLACDQANNVIAVLEELFHAYQLQQGCLQESWLKGDREFEAKVYDILVMSQTDFTSGLFDGVDTRSFVEYFNNPSAETYQKAYEEYINHFDIEGLYPLDRFPITQGFGIMDRMIYLYKLK